jgi:hypothetical protein
VKHQSRLESLGLGIGLWVNLFYSVVYLYNRNSEV